MLAQQHERIPGSERDREKERERESRRLSQSSSYRTLTSEKRSRDTMSTSSGGIGASRRPSPIKTLHSSQHMLACTASRACELTTMIGHGASAKGTASAPRADTKPRTKSDGRARNVRTDLRNAWPRESRVHHRKPGADMQASHSQPAVAATRGKHSTCSRLLVLEVDEYDAACSRERRLDVPWQSPAR